MGECELRLSYLSSEVPRNSFSFSGFVCIRKLAVSTNCPTVAEKPARKALKGYNRTTHVSTCTYPHYLPPSLLFSSFGQVEGGGKTYIIPHNDTIHKLQYPDQHQEPHKRI